MRTRNVVLLLVVATASFNCADTSLLDDDSRVKELGLAERLEAERRLITSKRQVEPTGGGSIASATDMAAALDIPASMLVSAQLTSPHAEAAMQLANFGNILPRQGNSMVVLSTGRINNLTQLPEPGTDFAPMGPDGDAVTLRVTVNVPPGANRLSFDFNFLSAESPEYVGSKYNDAFTVRVTDALGTREINNASVNSSFFYDVSATRAGGTGFDLLMADDPSGVDGSFGSYPPGIVLFPDSGITGFKTVTAEVASGGPVTIEFDIRDLADGWLDSTVVIDNVSFSSLETIDPNPRLIDQFWGTVKTDLAELATYGEPIEAVAADGATQILLRAKVPGPGKMAFSLVGGGSPADGSLSAIGSSSRSNSVLVDAKEAKPGQYYAFALYTSPEDFNDGTHANDKGRTVSIANEYTDTRGGGYRDVHVITLVRPPVVIVPDMWSGGCERWKGSSGIYANNLFELTCATYADDRATGSGSLDSNKGFVPAAVFEALREMRIRGIAVTQADVVAHGMGGLLTRKFVDWPTYRNPDNFNAGFINRIIFMNTPHVGTRIADEAVVMRDYLMANDPASWALVQSSLASQNPSISIDVGSGIDDLKTNSVAINSIGITGVPSHLMASRGGRAIPRNPGSLQMLTNPIKTLFTNMENRHPRTAKLLTPQKQKLILGPDSLIFCPDSLGVADEHDLFVAIDDQLGGVADNRVITYFDVVRSTPPATTEHFGVSSDTPHYDRLVALLNSPVNSELFAPSLPSPRDVPRVNHCPPWTPPPPVKNGNVQPLAQGGLRITSPAPGTSVTPGSNVKVVVEGYDGFQPAVVLLTGAGRAATLEASPFAIEFPIPPETIGAVELVAYGFDDQGAMVASAPVTLTVASTAVLTSIEVLNGDATLWGPGSTRRLVVLGHYNDGVTRNISSPGLGTLYSSSNLRIATVTTDGVVTGTGTGIGTIVVRNGTVVTSITVTVDDNSFISKPPVARCRNVVISADHACQAEAVVNDNSFDPDGGRVQCEQTPGGPYSLGRNQVTLTCRDDEGMTASCLATVTVVDDTPPALVCPAQEAVECQDGSGVASYAPVATDACGAATVTCTPVSGASFPLGTTAVFCTAMDAVGNLATCGFPVKVQDTQAPGLSLNGANPLRLECGIDTYSEPGAAAADACSGDLSQEIAIDSSSVNPNVEGHYGVSYQVVDPSGNASSGTRAVDVEDSTPPVITLLGASPLVLECGTPFTDPGATAADACYGDLTHSIVRTGSVDPLHPGHYPLRYGVTDGAGLTSTQVRNVDVVDTRPPELTPIATDPLWPPDHGMRTYRLSACARIQDLCGGSLDVDAVGRITSIYSDEREDSGDDGDGNTTGDIVITGPSSFQLRAERTGNGNGRVYGINFTVPDVAGNTMSASCRFTVPHDQSGRSAIDDGPSGGYTVYAP